MKPVIPFEPVSTENIFQGSTWVGQVKWDGVRVLTYYDGEQVRLFNRKLKERTYHYPELTNILDYCRVKSVILDGEVIALEEGKPSFYKVMQRDGITNLGNVKLVQQRVPIIYMVFDVLFWNGEWVTSRTLAQRQEILTNILKTHEHVQLVENFQDSSGLFQVVQQQKLEGIVLKDLNSTYLINGRDKRWLKKKIFEDLVAVVGGVTYRGSLVNALLLGLYDSAGKLIYIGQVGSGKLTQKELYNFTQSIKPFVQNFTPFTNRPPRFKEAVWLRPELTVKVKFTQWTKGYTLRQPTLEGFVKVEARECTFPENIQ